MVCFQDIENEIRSLYFEPDIQAWKLLVICATAHYYEPRGLAPVWLLINGRQGSGKSDMVTALKYLPTYYALGEVTAKTFFSGFKASGQVDMALMVRIKQPPLLVMKDFGSILSKDVSSKAIILNQLRMIYDGHNPADSGMGHVEWRGRCTFLSVCTPGSFENDRASFHYLGERFLDICLRPADNLKLNKYLLERDQEPTKDHLAELIRDYVSPLCGPIKPPTPKLPADMIDPISGAIALAGAARTSVHRDRNSKEVDQVSDTESTSRMLMGLKAILLTASALEKRPTVTTDELNLCLRVARQSVPRFRLLALRGIWPEADMLDTNWNHTTRWHMPLKTRDRALEELVEIGVVTRNNTHYTIDENLLSGHDLINSTDI